MILSLREKILLSICFLLVLFTSMFQLIEVRAEMSNKNAERTSAERIHDELQQVINSTVAQSVLIYDLKNNALVAGKAMDKEMSLASITKIFTSAMVYENFLRMRSKDNTETQMLLERIQLMMARSSNEEAEALGLYVANTSQEAVLRLNEYAKPYGLTFKNLSGLDLKETHEVGGLGVTADLARGIRDIYFKYPELFDKTILPYDDNTNIIAGKLDFFLAGKTGFTEYSGGNLAVIIQKGITHKYLIIVLGSTENDRFVDVEQIVKALLQLNV